MTRTRNFVALDLGAESGRAMLASLDNGKVTLTEAHRFPNGPVRLGDTLYWDLPRLFAEIKIGLGKAAQIQPELDGIGCDTWGVDFGLIDRNGTLVGLPVHYRDKRNDGMLEKAFERMPREEIFRCTGIQFMQINTAYQLLAVSLSNPRLLECADRLLLVSGLLTWLLSGRQIEEFTNATTSQLYDPCRGGWSLAVLQALGIPSRIMPEVVPPASVVGSLRTDITDELRLSPSIPVIAPACHDTGAAVAAVPAENDTHWAYLSSGTWSLMGVELPQPLIHDEALAGNFTNEGGVRGTFRFLKNIMGLWLVQECRRIWEREGQKYDYAALTQMAANAGPSPALINPDDPAFLAPADMPEAIRAFCRRTGQAVPEAPAAIVRCALDSLALTYRHVLTSIERITGRRVDRLHVVGGGSRNQLLNQLTADAIGRPVIAGPVEATALGNALCQAMALGDIGSLSELRAVVRASVVTETFTPRDRDRAEERYAQFLALRQP